MRFIAKGLPGPKGSRNVGRRKDGTIYTREQSARATQWQKDVALQARSAMAGRGPIEPPYAVTLHFTFPTPKNPSYLWPTKADLDKVERATLDGLKVGGVIVDDKHVIESVTYKRFGDEGYAYISVSQTHP